MNKIIQSNFEEHKEVLSQINSLEVTIEKVAKLLICSLKENKTIFWCGNGGSASDSQHLTGELIGRFKGDRKPLKSVSLNADSAVMTCIVNDYGYDQIFKRQIEAVATEKDIIMVISTSGNSKNIISAIQAAKEKKSMTIGLLGETNGKAKDIVDISISVPSNFTPHIQEAHIMIGHIICQIIDESI